MGGTDRVVESELDVEDRLTQDDLEMPLADGGKVIGRLAVGNFKPPTKERWGWEELVNRGLAQRCEKIKLNMGAGVQRYKGYIGVDVEETPACDLVHDLREPLSLPDGCASHIFASHVLEHIEGWRALGVLRDWFRLLADKGVLWGYVPDALEAMTSFQDAVDEQDEWAQRRWTDVLLGGSATDMNAGDSQTHHMLYTQELLKNLLISAGFDLVDVKREQPGVWDYRIAFYAAKGYGKEAELTEPQIGVAE